MQEILGIDLTELHWRAWLETARDFILPRLAQSLLQLLLVVVVLWVARRALRYLERQVTTRTATKLDDVLLLMASRVVMLSVAFWGLWRLADIWALPGFGNFIVAIWIVALALPVSRFLGDITKVLEDRVVSETETKLDDTALPWINRSIQIITVGSAVMIALRYLGIDITPLIAGASVAGFAFSFAARDTLANLIAGILLVIDRPFEVGDRIELWNSPARQASWGDVLEVGIRATKIRTPDNIIIIIPNSEIMKRDIVNWTASGETIRLRIPLGIAYDADVEHAKRIILEVAGACAGVLERAAAGVHPAQLRRLLGGPGAARLARERKGAPRRRRSHHRGGEARLRRARHRDPLPEARSVYQIGRSRRRQRRDTRGRSDFHPNLWRQRRWLTARSKRAPRSPSIR